MAGYCKVISDSLSNINPWYVAQAGEHSIDINFMIVILALQQANFINMATKFVGVYFSEILYQLVVDIRWKSFFPPSTSPQREDLIVESRPRPPVGRVRMRGIVARAFSCDNLHPTLKKPKL